MLKVSFGLHQFFFFFSPAPSLCRYLSGEQGNHSSDSSREIVMAATNLDFRGEYRSFCDFLTCRSRWLIGIGQPSVAGLDIHWAQIELSS